MTAYSPQPVGAIKTKVLILLIALIVSGVAGTVLFTQSLKLERKPQRATNASLAWPANPPPGMTSAANTIEMAHYANVL